MPDTLLLDPHPHRAGNAPHLPERFLAPEGLVWGRFMTADGAVLRWGHLPVRGARAECVIAGGFGDFIEMHFETVRDLAARGFGVWCFDWRGQGGSVRPERWPARPRARHFDRDAADLADFVTSRVMSRLPRVLIAHSMGGAIPPLCLPQNPTLIGIAGRELVVSVTAQRRAARLLPNCTVAELSESKHQPFLERDAVRSAWLEHIDRFLAAQLSR